MCEHHGEHTVVPQHPVCLSEDGRHLVLVVGVCEFLAPPSIRGESFEVRDRLVVLVCQFGLEQIWPEMPEGPLLPDVEEVCKFGVHHVVVVRRIDHDRTNGTGVDVFEIAQRSPW